MRHDMISTKSKAVPWMVLVVLADGAAVGQQRDLGGDGEADPLVSDVVLAVVAAEEDVAQDPEAAGGLDAHEAGQAHGSAALLDLENVVLALQGGRAALPCACP